tara:strand:+ start:320 stop:622 length:303 start_codon:yes stop_codon:yes gene_type:complete
MTNNPFKLRSGNGTPFKQMGASPTKQTSDAYKRSQEAPVHTPADTTGKAAYMKDPKNFEKFLSENPNEMSFGAAFSTARKAGDKEFTFKGKQYTTKLKDE